MRMSADRGSFLPVLIPLIQNTFGPVLELGVGFCSTPYLHWACYPKRRLVSYENNPTYFKFAEIWKSEYHDIHCIENFDKIDISSPWSIAFVDHSPETRRRTEVSKLVDTDFVVIHDSENRNSRKHKLPTIHRLFKTRYKYTDAYPFTSVWSNKYDYETIHNYLSSK